MGRFYGRKRRGIAVQWRRRRSGSGAGWRWVGRGRVWGVWGEAGGLGDGLLGRSILLLLRHDRSSSGNPGAIWISGSGRVQVGSKMETKQLTRIYIYTRVYKYKSIRVL